MRGFILSLALLCLLPHAMEASYCDVNDYDVDCAIAAEVLAGRAVPTAATACYAEVTDPHVFRCKHFKATEEYKLYLGKTDQDCIDGCDLHWVIAEDNVCGALALEYPDLRSWRFPAECRMEGAPPPATSTPAPYIPIRKDICAETEFNLGCLAHYEAIHSWMSPHRAYCQTSNTNPKTFKCTDFHSNGEFPITSDQCAKLCHAATAVFAGDLCHRAILNPESLPAECKA